MRSQEPELRKSTLTSEQIRAGRMLLRWEQKDLAIRSGISLPCIKRLETQPGELGALESTIRAFRDAFERAGVKFSNGYFLGLRLRRNRAETIARRRQSNTVKTIKKALPRKRADRISKELK
jgi:hypothetical protein